MGKEIILCQKENRLVALKTSPQQYFADLHPKRIEDVFLSNEPSIISIKSKHGETVARAAVSYLLSEALEFFNVKETMSDIQVAITVDLILEEYPYLQTDDLKLCFKNAMKLKYGQIYNRIDGQIVMSWLKSYDIERSEKADIESYNRHKEVISKEETSGLYYDEYLAELERKAEQGDEEAKKALEMSSMVKKMLCKR
ncbi:hypothetical protein [Bacteroides sp.]|uniref:hypothetical protein n=1 Tax=Bacteroides sp. TaxID=29523 RepID=UPI003D0E60B2